MFTKEDLKEITYFNILSMSEKEHEIQSKNTKHYWHIVRESEYSYVLFHKHHAGDDYHFQTSYGSLFDAVLDIVNHDEYQLRGRKPARFKWQRENTFFNELIKIYGM